MRFIFRYFFPSIFSQVCGNMAGSSECIILFPIFYVTSNVHFIYHQNNACNHLCESVVYWKWLFLSRHEWYINEILCCKSSSMICFLIIMIVSYVGFRIFISFHIPFLTKWRKETVEGGGVGGEEGCYYT